MTAMTDDRLAEIEGACSRMPAYGLDNGLFLELLAEVKRLRALQSMPSWDEAPKWAQWLAMDADGSWTWFDRKPFPVEMFSKGLWMTAPNEGIFSEANIDRWQNVLQERPK